MSRDPSKKTDGQRPRFGRRPAESPSHPKISAPPPNAGRLKRSTKVILVMAGTGALGMCMVARDPLCRPNDPTQTGPCRTSSSGGSSGYYGAGSSSSSSSAQAAVTRGGFGSTGSAISAHGG